MQLKFFTVFLFSFALLPVHSAKKTLINNQKIHSLFSDKLAPKEIPLYQDISVHSINQYLVIFVLFNLIIGVPLYVIMDEEITPEERFPYMITNWIISLALDLTLYIFYISMPSSLEWLLDVQSGKFLMTNKHIFYHENTSYSTTEIKLSMIQYALPYEGVLDLIFGTTSLELVYKNGLKSYIKGIKYAPLAARILNKAIKKNQMDKRSIEHLEAAKKAS
ncbi:MAG: hypothetical protein AAF380_00685 [Bacteroidota bacterium]